MRVDGRAAEEMRPVKVTTNYLKYAEGSVLIELGETKVICAASIDNKVPPHVKDSGHGWLTAEYAMLPRSSKQRITRDSMRGSIAGRSYEIQRLIGRSLRAVCDLQKLGERTIILDCDVVQADGGTRCAAITGSFIAVVLALQRLREDNKIGNVLPRDFVAATSVGIVEGRPVLDLCYLEDAQAPASRSAARPVSARPGRGLRRPSGIALTPDHGLYEGPLRRPRHELRRVGPAAPGLRSGAHLGAGSQAVGQA